MSSVFSGDVPRDTTSELARQNAELAAHNALLVKRAEKLRVLLDQEQAARESDRRRHALELAGNERDADRWYQFCGWVSEAIKERGE